MMLIKNKTFLWKDKSMAFWQKTRHFGKITAFDENHGFRDYLLCLPITPSPLLAFGLKFLASGVPQDKFLATPMGSVSNPNCCKRFWFKEKVENHWLNISATVQTAAMGQIPRSTERILILANLRTWSTEYGIGRRRHDLAGYVMFHRRTATHHTREHRVQLQDSEHRYKQYT